MFLGGQNLFWLVTDHLSISFDHFLSFWVVVDCFGHFGSFAWFLILITAAKRYTTTPQSVIELFSSTEYHRFKIRNTVQFNINAKPHKIIKQHCNTTSLPFLPQKDLKRLHCSLREFQLHKGVS